MTDTTTQDREAFEDRLFSLLDKFGDNQEPCQKIDWLESLDCNSRLTNHKLEAVAIELRRLYESNKQLLDGANEFIDYEDAVENGDILAAFPRYNAASKKLRAAANATKGAK